VNYGSKSDCALQFSNCFVPQSRLRSPARCMCHCSFSSFVRVFCFGFVCRAQIAMASADIFACSDKLEEGEIEIPNAALSTATPGVSSPKLTLVLAPLDAHQVLVLKKDQTSWCVALVALYYVERELFTCESTRTQHCGE